MQVLRQEISLDKKYDLVSMPISSQRPQQGQSFPGIINREALSCALVMPCVFLDMSIIGNSADNS